jgi:nitrogen regulatory protein PII
MEMRKKLTIITEAILETILLDDIEKLGAKGHTIFEVSGKGARGARKGDWEQNRNVQIDIICDEQVASKIAQHCAEKYYQHYAMIIYLSDVEVLRPQKF